MSWHSIFCLTLFYLLPPPQKKMNLTSRFIYSLGYYMFVYITKITNRFQAWSFSLFDTTKVHNAKSFARKYDYYSSNEDVWVYSVKKCFFNDLLEYVLSLIKIHWIIWQLFSNELIDTRFFSILRIRFKSLFNKLKNFSNDPYSNNLICYTIYRTIQFFLHA